MASKLGWLGMTLGLVPEVVIERPASSDCFKEFGCRSLRGREGTSRSSLRDDALRARARRGDFGSSRGDSTFLAIKLLKQSGECESIFMSVVARIDD